MKIPNFLLTSWKLLTKIAGSGSEAGSIIQRYRSPDPDPYLNFIDPHCNTGSKNSPKKNILVYTFSDFSYVDKSLSVTEFICEWEVRLQSALAAGCQYSDAVLAFKLLHNSELDNSDIQQSKLVQ